MKSDNNWEWYVVYQARTWFEGVIYQGNRLQAIVSKQNDINKRIFESEPQQFREINQYNNIFPYERYFYIQALDRSIEFLKLSIEYIPNLKDILNEIEASIDLQYIKDIRNMNVHDIEYIDKRKFRKRYEEIRKRFFYSTDGVCADATSTVVDGEEIKIGNRLNVTTVARKYSELIPKVICLCDEFLFQQSRIDN